MTIVSILNGEPEIVDCNGSSYNQISDIIQGLFYPIKAVIDTYSVWASDVEKYGAGRMLKENILRCFQEEKAMK